MAKVVCYNGSLVNWFYATDILEYIILLITDLLEDLSVTEEVLG